MQNCIVIDSLLGIHPRHIQDTSPLSNVLFWYPCKRYLATVLLILIYVFKKRECILFCSHQHVM